MYLEVIFAQIFCRVQAENIWNPYNPHRTPTSNTGFRKIQTRKKALAVDVLKPEDEKQVQYQGVMLSSNLCYPLF